jgi:subtilisin family serine protease
MNGIYDYGTATGRGVNVYVVDGGVAPDTTEFGSRVTHDFSVFLPTGYDHRTCPHATEVARYLGGATMGVAKAVKIHSVKVTEDCQSFETSNLVKGLDWIAAHAQKPAVVNLSLGATGSHSDVDAAVNRLLNAGITVVAAAGQAQENGQATAIDACKITPAKIPNVITVAGAQPGDVAMSTSDYGSCVDLYAPAGNLFGSCYCTSWAAPHVAGVAAFYLQANPTLAPAMVQGLIVGNSTAGKLKGVPAGTPNFLLFSQVPVPITPDPALSNP